MSCHSSLDNTFPPKVVGEVVSHAPHFLILVNRFLTTRVLVSFMPTKNASSVSRLSFRTSTPTFLTVYWCITRSSIPF